jgi:hypothetical protein
MAKDNLGHGSYGRYEMPSGDKKVPSAHSRETAPVKPVISREFGDMSGASKFFGKNGYLYKNKSDI